MSTYIKNLFLKLMLFVVAFFITVCSAETVEEIDKEILPILAEWQEGYLDIHHINTGRGDAAYFIFPDGTTMLFDAGDLGLDNLPKHKPLKVVKPKPNNSKQPGEWISEYIKQARPKNRALSIDYALISHFHEDHYGDAIKRNKKSNSGQYKLAGITEVGDFIPIKTLIDRDYPDYNSPVDLAEVHGENFINYLAYTKEKISQGMSMQKLDVGKDDQITLKFSKERFLNFSVRNIKRNGTIWKGKGEQVFNYFNLEETVDENGKFNENLFSLALEVSYGKFNYFTGGDMTGLQGFGLPKWFDVETPVADVVGQVDVLTLNHHGNRDATNAYFLEKLAPRVIVQQSWVSDHPGGEVLHRMISEKIYPGPRDIFTTNMLEETKVAIGPWLIKAYTSFEGHVVIRVYPGGEEYRVFILDDHRPGLNVKAIYGPYPSN